MTNFEKAQKHFFEGVAFFQNNDFTQAEMMFVKALEMVPERVSVLTNLSATQIKLKKFDQASYAAKKALTIDVKNFKEGYKNRRTNCTLLYGNAL